MPRRRFSQHFFMSKKAVNLSIHEKVVAEAEAIMNLLGYSSLTPLVEELIRTEYEKRFGIVRQVNLEPSEIVDPAALADKLEQSALDDIRQRHALQPTEAPAHPPEQSTPGTKGRSTKSTVRKTDKSSS